MEMGLAVYDPNAVLAAFDTHRGVRQRLSTLRAAIHLYLFWCRYPYGHSPADIHRSLFSVALFSFGMTAVFSALYEHWQNVYHWHWWLARWEYSLMATVALECFLIWQFIKYGRQELAPEMSPALFGTLAVLGTLAIGSIWWLIKMALADDLYLISFVITAGFPAIPFHTGMLLRRKSRAGQSIWMQISVLLVHVSMSAIGMTVAPSFFMTPAFLTYFGVFVIWAFINIALILYYSPATQKQTLALAAE